MNTTQRKTARSGAADTTRTEYTSTTKGRGKSRKSIELIQAAKIILEEIQPATIRAVCYRLFILKIIPSMAKCNTNRVGGQLVWAREQGIIPWAWVVDETREAERIASWERPEEIIKAAVSQYRKNYWTDQSNRVEVWSEKGTIRGTLAPVLNEYGITFRVMHGYGSATTLHSIAGETAQSDKPMTILYVGDYDPSGLHMSELDLPRRLELYNGKATIRRVALDKSDVTDTDLPSFEAESKSKDPRYKWFVQNYGKQAWELDALSPVILRQRVEREILNLIDAGAWEHAKGIEAAEIESMSGILTNWQSISRQASKYSKGVG